MVTGYIFLPKYDFAWNLVSETMNVFGHGLYILLWGRMFFNSVLEANAKAKS